jgi:ribose transport system substrate-binding protein
MALQLNDQPGKVKVAHYTPLSVFTQADVASHKCWTLDTLN